MEFRISPGAAEYVQNHGGVVTIQPLVISNCCGAPLPPEVRLGAPHDPDGFAVYEQDGITVYYDSLLDPRPLLEIELKDYGLLQELVLANWN